MPCCRALHFEEDQTSPLKAILWRYDGNAQPGTHGNAALASGNGLFQRDSASNFCSPKNFENARMATLLIHNAHTIATQNDARTELRNASIFIRD